MKITTRGRYALRLLVDIAGQGEGAIVSLAEVSARQDISAKYLEQIVSKLTRTGFLKGVRGTQGGYRLTRSPEECSVGDILRAMEGSLAPTSCLTAEKNSCARCHSCDTLWFWTEMDHAINRFVDSYTLADFLKRAKSGTAGEPGGASR